MVLRRKLLAIYVVAGLIVVVGSLATWGVLRLRSATSWTQHTRDVLASADAVVASLASAESALRAYQATGDTSYLPPAQALPAATERQLDRLARLTRGEPSQRARVEALAAAARARLASIREAGLAGPGEEPAQRIQRVRLGTQQMDRVRQAAQAVRQEQEALLRRHVALERSLAWWLLAVIVIGSLASGLLVVLLARAVRADVLRQERNARQLEEQTRELTRQAEELRLTAEHLREANAELRELRDQAEAARAASERAAEEAGRARAMQSRFMAMTTHEIRQPINALLGFAQLLELEVAGPLTEGQRKQLARIIAGGQHLRGLVDDYLDLAKADAGQLSVEVVRAPVTEAMGSAVELVTPQAMARDIRIQVEDDTRCGSYRGDPQRVRQVLVNLLSNAVKFTPSGGRLTLRCLEAPPPHPLDERDDAAGWVCFEVTDTGPGIPPEQLETVFEPFVQHGEGSPRQGTTGLGLTISRKLAQLMGGDLTVASALGLGSTFALWLPRPAPTPASADPDGAADPDAQAEMLG